MRFPAAFLDRDGTLITDVNYLRSPDQIRLLETGVEGMRILTRAGVPIVIVTNQAGIARGYLTEEGLFEIHQVLLGRLAAAGISVAGIYYCPHHASEGEPPYRAACACRKPRPGMLLRAARDLGLDLAASMMAGDAPSDAEAGLAAGCGASYLLGGAGRAAPAGARRAGHLAEAVRDWLEGG